MNETEMLLGQLCHDLENCEGAVSYFEIPDYVKPWWSNHRQKFYLDRDKQQRYQKYLELKKEFDVLDKEFNSKKDDEEHIPPILWKKKDNNLG